MTPIPIYFTYFWYQNFTANALQIIRILIQHLLHGCHMDLVKKLGVTRLKLPRSKFFDPKKNERALLGKNRLVEDRSRKSDPRALLNQTRPSWITGFSLLILITFSLCSLASLPSRSVFGRLQQRLLRAEHFETAIAGHIAGWTPLLLSSRLHQSASLNLVCCLLIIIH